MQARTISVEEQTLVDPFKLIDELAQAYEASLHLQNALRPLIPAMTWYQTADAVWEWEGAWPVEKLNATIMFTDIAGFTALIETYPVEDVLDSLNHYFTLLSQIIQQHRGDVHKFTGDGIMALFVCPTDAARAGCEIQRAVAKFNASQSAQGLWRFETRLAIDTGEVVLTSVGPTDRQDRTVLGRPVNLAAHLNKAATPGMVWISQRTYDKLADQGKNGFAPRTPATARDKELPDVVYESVH